MAVTIGVDPHKASNTIAVLEADETVLVGERFVNSVEGFDAMLEAVADIEDRLWAVEGAFGMGRSVAQRLVAVGEVVVDVPAKLATRVRVYSEGHGRKTDSHDAISIAKAALHSSRLRRVTRDGDRVALKLLVDRRRELTSARTQAACRLHRLLRELIPGGARRELSTIKAKALLEGVCVEGPAEVMRLQLAAEHVADIERLELRLDEIAAQITIMVKATDTTVTRIFGVGFLSAGVILAEVGDITRFPSRDHLASYAGTAPIEVSSGDVARHRLSRAGNRQLNSAIHVAAIAQIRHGTPGRDYYRRKIAAGKTKREALRCLKRRITDAIWRQLQIDTQLEPEHQDQSWPRWPSTRGTSPTYLSPATPRANGLPMRPRPAA